MNKKFKVYCCDTLTLDEAAFYQYLKAIVGFGAKNIRVEVVEK